MEIHPITWVIPVAGLAAVAFALYLARDVLRSRHRAREAMQESRARSSRARLPSSAPVHDHRPAGPGRRGDHRPRHRPGRDARRWRTPASSALRLGIMTGVAFLVGAACSMASGIIGMYISVQVERAHRRRRPRAAWCEAVQVAMRGGAVSGFLVVALSLLGVWAHLRRLRGLHRLPNEAPVPDRRASASAPASWPSSPSSAAGSTPRPPTWAPTWSARSRPASPRTTRATRRVIADLVGDNVGDCAGRGADLFESTAAENIGAMILGVAVFTASPQSRRLAEPRGVDLLPAGGPRLRPAGHDRGHLLRPRQRGRRTR